MSAKEGQKGPSENAFQGRITSWRARKDLTMPREDGSYSTSSTYTINIVGIEGKDALPHPRV